MDIIKIFVFYQTLNKMKHIYKEDDLTAPRDNVRKNRNPEVIPTDVNRVHLMTMVPDRNDYINAVFQHVRRKLTSEKLNQQM